MGRKKKVVEPVEVKPEVKMYEYGDLAVICSKCGSTQIIQKGIQHGMQFILVPREDSVIQLRCDKCDTDIKLCFLEGVKPEQTETEIEEPVVNAEPVVNTEEVNEGVQKEDKQEQGL